MDGASYCLAHSRYRSTGDYRYSCTCDEAIAAVTKIANLLRLRAKQRSNDFVSLMLNRPCIHWLPRQAIPIGCIN